MPSNERSDDYTYPWGVPPNDVPEALRVVGVDWGAGGDWTVYLSPYGVHRSDQPCRAPVLGCPCKWPDAQRHAQPL